MLPLAAVAVLLQASAAQLTRAIEFYTPAWSPDSRTLAFESTLDGKFSIYTISGDGTALRRLTTDTANNEQPGWSPDGKRIVFSSDRAGHLDLYVMNADGSGQTRLTTTNGGGYYRASFSPDGQWILFQGRPETREARDRVYVIRSDGTGNWRRLSDSTVGAEGPTWSQDGRTITFQEVPYAKRFWNEMTFEDMQAAKRGARMVTVRMDGARVSTAPLPAPAQRQDRAYIKEEDGAQGLYIGDRLLVGGRGAGPIGYLRTAMLTPLVDTIDTYTSPKSGGAVTAGNRSYVVRTIRQTRGRRWEIIDTWYDSTGRQTAWQYARTAPGSVRTELELVRATTDSASLLISNDHVTGWVVPAGQTPRLFDSAGLGERYAGVVIASAIARTHPQTGSVLLAPTHNLYGASPIPVRVDSTRVVRRDTLYDGTRALPVVVLERAGGTQLWMDEATGAEILSRGNAGPERYWWHVRRGVSPPRVR